MTFLLPLVAQPAATAWTAEMGIHLLRRRSSSDVDPHASGDDDSGSDNEDYWVAHRLRPCPLTGFFSIVGSFALSSLPRSSCVAAGAFKGIVCITTILPRQHRSRNQKALARARKRRYPVFRSG
jgi:hypothetical protein